MKKKHISTFLSTLTAALLLAGALSSCAGKILHQTTVGDLTYTLHGTNDRVEQITVSRDGRRIGAFQKRGLPGQISGDDYGFRLTDLNFDRHTDMQLLVAQAEAGDMYATYLWDAEAEKYVYHPQLSTLQNMGMIASLGVLTARESSVTIDPATDDTPEFEICRDAFILYRCYDTLSTESFVEADDDKALEWLELSADFHYMDAMYWLGIAYMGGTMLPVEYDEYEAKELFEECALIGGMPEAMVELGNLCYCRRDLDGARKLYEKALEAGEEDARQRLEKLEKGEDPTEE
jgi:hypothetical protein